MKNLVWFLIRGPGYRIELNMRLMFWLRKQGHHRLALYVSNRMQRKYGVFISPKTRIGKGLTLKHPIAIVIGEGVTIGNHVTIYQNVTLGGARLGDSKRNAYPQVEDGVTIFAGAVLIGDIRVGAHAVVGANSVVNRDVPANSVVAGVPAKLISPRTTVREAKVREKEKLKE